MYTVHQESGANQGETPGIGESPSSQPISGPVIFSKRQALSRAVVVNSLEPGPSRARYFPREMLLLTTTARERAWRLLKITSPLIGWFDGDSPIPGISPWLAPLSRCTQYIVEVQRTLCSCLFVFEIRTVGWQPCCFHEARRSRRCGV